MNEAQFDLLKKIDDIVSVVDPFASKNAKEVVSQITIDLPKLSNDDDEIFLVWEGKIYLEISFQMENYTYFISSDIGSKGESFRNYNLEDILELIKKKDIYENNR